MSLIKCLLEDTHVSARTVEGLKGCSDNLKDKANFIPCNRNFKPLLRNRDLHEYVYDENPYSEVRTIAGGKKVEAWNRNSYKVAGLIGMFGDQTVEGQVAGIEEIGWADRRQS